MCVCVCVVLTDGRSEHADRNSPSFTLDHVFRYSFRKGVRVRILVQQTAGTTTISVRERRGGREERNLRRRYGVQNFVRQVFGQQNQLVTVHVRCVDPFFDVVMIAHGVCGGNVHERLQLLHPFAQLDHVSGSSYVYCDGQFQFLVEFDRGRHMENHVHLKFELAAV